METLCRQSRREGEVTQLHADLEKELAEAERKAWNALGRYKFQMFGYWAAIWVHLNRLGKFKRANPWKKIVREARVA